MDAVASCLLTDHSLMTKKKNKKQWKDLVNSILTKWSKLSPVMKHESLTPNTSLKPEKETVLVVFLPPKNSASSKSQHKEAITQILTEGLIDLGFFQNISIVTKKGSAMFWLKGV